MVITGLWVLEATAPGGELSLGLCQGVEGVMEATALVVGARSVRYLFPDGRGTNKVCPGWVLSVLIDLAFLFRRSPHRVQVWELSSYDLFS